jgi:hypothetical protein
LLERLDFRVLLLNDFFQTLDGRQGHTVGIAGKPGVQNRPGQVRSGSLNLNPEESVWTSRRKGEGRAVEVRRSGTCQAGGLQECAWRPGQLELAAGCGL